MLINLDLVKCLEPFIDRLTFSSKHDYFVFPMLPETPTSQARERSEFVRFDLLGTVLQFISKKLTFKITKHTL